MEAGMGITRFALLTAAALACGTQAMAQTIDQTEKQAVVARAGEMLTERYVFPDRAAQAKAKMDQALATGDYDSITDANDFATRLTADLQSVTHDKHMRVTLNNPAPPPQGASQPVPPKTSAGFTAADVLKGNIGYIKLLGFGPIESFTPSADQAMASVAGTKALIIDMRDNGGGDPHTVQYLASFFFDPKTPVHINDLIYRKPGTETYQRDEFWTKPAPIYYKKPVYLLTSGRTFSGGEEFLYDLQTQKRARLIGEVTGGGANPGGAPPINPHFRIFIPGGRAENPITKTNWEGTGVAPDAAVTRDQALRVAMLEITKDKALKSEKAMETDAFVPRHLLKFREGPQPGGTEALRLQLEQLARGEPDYGRMTDRLAEATREQLPRLKTDLAALGEIKTVTFKNIDLAGVDVYEVACAKGSLRSGIFLTPEGKIALNWVQKMPGQ
jgi:hypothetical protein